MEKFDRRINIPFARIGFINLIKAILTCEHNTRQIAQNVFLLLKIFPTQVVSD